MAPKLDPNEIKVSTELLRREVYELTLCFSCFPSAATVLAVLPDSFTDWMNYRWNDG